MEKRIFLAFLLSLMIIVGWTTLTSRTQHVENKYVTLSEQQEPAQPVVSSSSVAVSSSPSVSSVSFNVTAKIPDLEAEESTARLNSNGTELYYGERTGAIKQIFFTKFNHTIHINSGFKLEGVKFDRINTDDGVFSASSVDAQKEVNLRIDTRNHNGINNLNIELRNISAQEIAVPFKFILARTNFAEKDFNLRFYQAIAGFRSESLRPDLKKNFISDRDINFIAFSDKYTCIILEPQDGEFKAFIEKTDAQHSIFGITTAELKIPANSSKKIDFLIYLGPQELEQIGRLRQGWSNVVYFGFFDPIVKLLLKVIKFFHVITRNWGLAIILLSLLIFFCSFPLTLKQMKSMKEMQALQPKIEKLRVAYKSNPQKLNKEVMELYKEHKINPLGGCLPLLLQMPIFFSLYQVLMRSVELKNSGFLWIKDLSEPDRVFKFGQSIPLLGNDLNILPILMAIVMFFQQKMNTAASAGQSAEQQKMMAIIFPVMFGFIFYNMPSGLVLYWFLNSLLMTIFQVRMVRHG